VAIDCFVFYFPFFPVFSFMLLPSFFFVAIARAIAVVVAAAGKDLPLERRLVFVKVLGIRCETLEHRVMQNITIRCLLKQSRKKGNPCTVCRPGGVSGEDDTSWSCASFSSSSRSDSSSAISGEGARSLSSERVPH